MNHSDGLDGNMENKTLQVGEIGLRLMVHKSMM